MLAAGFDINLWVRHGADLALFVPCMPQEPMLRMSPVGHPSCLVKEPSSWLLSEQVITDLVCWASSIVTLSRRKPSTAPSNIFPLECGHLPWDVSSSDVEHGG